MENRFFEHPILKSAYKPPAKHWELDDQGQPTQRTIQRNPHAHTRTPGGHPYALNGDSYGERP